MLDILNLTFEELSAFITHDLGEPAFRANQLWQWLWQKGARAFSEMTNLAKPFRERLAREAKIVWPELVREAKSRDGTVKFLLRLADGALIETVLIPNESQEGEGRLTQCLSCQVGCPMGCTFCSTGAMGFTRNMTHGEILGQTLFARAYLGDFHTRERLRNLVFMGMGEPLMNFKELVRSLHTLNSEAGLGFSPRRITVPTCGLPSGIRELGESKLAYLAVSLHATTQELRQQIMPGAASWDLDKLLAALEGYPLKAREHLTLEYLLLGGVNDRPEDAEKLARICGRLGGKVNLIAYNETENSPYRAPAPETVLRFEKILWKKGITAILRKSKGQDIQAACGQLRASVLHDEAQSI